MGLVAATGHDAEGDGVTGGTILYRRISLTRSSATAEIARVGGRYAVQGHLTSLALVPIESPYATSY